MQVRDYSPEQIRSYVFNGVADGASCVFCNLSRTMIIPEAVDRVKAFMDIAREVDQYLADDCPREELKKLI